MSRLTTAQILAIIPVPPVFMVSPFLIDGVRSWMGWVDVVLTIIWLALLFSLASADVWIAVVFFSIALLIFYILGILKAFGRFDTPPLEEEEGEVGADRAAAFRPFRTA